MLMRFIGQDGSMGLKHGKVYSVRIESKYHYFWVRWGFYDACPYDSRQSLEANWEEI